MTDETYHSASTEITGFHPDGKRVDMYINIDQTRAAHIAGMREAAALIADGCPRVHSFIYRIDGKHSKHDRCSHGIVMYDECMDCVVEAIRAAADRMEKTHDHTE